MQNLHLAIARYDGEVVGAACLSLVQVGGGTSRRGQPAFWGACLLAFGIRKDKQRKGLGTALFLDSLVPWAVRWGTAAAEGDEAAAGVLLVESALQRDAPFNFWSHLLGHKLGCAITECSTDAELREWVAKAKLPGGGSLPKALLLPWRVGTNGAYPLSVKLADVAAAVQARNNVPDDAESTSGEEGGGRTTPTPSEPRPRRNRYAEICCGSGRLAMQRHCKFGDDVVTIDKPDPDVQQEFLDDSPARVAHRERVQKLEEHKRDAESLLDDRAKAAMGRSLVTHFKEEIAKLKAEQKAWHTPHEVIRDAFAVKDPPRGRRGHRGGGEPGKRGEAGRGQAVVGHARDANREGDSRPGHAGVPAARAGERRC